MNENILRRLLLAKSFLADAQKEMLRSYDENSLAKATNMLHDAVDNMLGAVASHEGIHLKDKSFLTTTYNTLTTHGVKLTHRAQVNQLNTHRNGIKHQGVLPNVKDMIALLPEVVSFCESTCTAVFNTPLSKVSRKQSIADPGARLAIEKIEHAIDGEDYKQALLEAATSFYIYFEEPQFSTLRFSSMVEGVRKGRLSSYDRAFPSGAALDLTVELLRAGVDPYAYNRFKNLTPDVGRSIWKGPLIFNKDSSTWYEYNWTEENALFALNFVIDSLIQLQQKQENYFTGFRDVRHKIRFTRQSEVLSYSKEVLKFFGENELLDCKLLSFADGELQLGKFSDDGYTEALVTYDDQPDIWLLKIGDFMVVKEETASDTV